MAKESLNTESVPIDSMLLCMIVFAPSFSEGSKNVPISGSEEGDRILEVGVTGISLAFARIMYRWRDRFQRVDARQARQKVG